MFVVSCRDPVAAIWRFMDIVNISPYLPRKTNNSSFWVNTDTVSPDKRKAWQKDTCCFLSKNMSSWRVMCLSCWRSSPWEYEKFLLPDNWEPRVRVITCFYLLRLQKNGRPWLMRWRLRDSRLTWTTENRLKRSWMTTRSAGFCWRIAMISKIS